MKTKTAYNVCVCTCCESSIQVHLKNINDNLYWFYCSKCQITSDPKTTFQSAIKEWNKLQERNQS